MRPRPLDYKQRRRCSMLMPRILSRYSEGNLICIFVRNLRNPSTVTDRSTSMAAAVEATLNNDSVSDSKQPIIYRCKKCRRIVAAEEHIVSHERGGGQKCFKWKKRNTDSDMEAPECSSIFVEPMKWMQSVEEGCVGDKLQCIGCKARLGSFNWAGMQCNCGAWINPAFQLHKSRIDECRL